MRIDNFYFVVNDIEKSVDFYSKLLESEPSEIIETRWAEWKNENSQIYFGLISREATECNLIQGNNGVLGLYTNDINKSFELCKSIGAKILYELEEVANSKDHYKCFAIEDYDGNKIEIAYYDK